MTCQHILFSKTNLMDEATITSTPSSDTPLEWLKNEFRSRQAKWTDFSTDEIVIEGTFPQLRYVDYFAIPGSNIGSNTNGEIKIEFFKTLTSTTDLLGTGFQPIGEMIPLGEWSAGVDPYGEDNLEPLNNTYAIWFNKLYGVRRFKITIKHNFGGTGGTTVSDGIPLQDANGLVSIEAENAPQQNNFIDSWAPFNGGGTSGGQGIQKLGGFNASSGEGPQMVYRFTATQSGTFRLWVRAASNTMERDSIFSIFEGVTATHVYHGLPASGFVWHSTRTLTLEAGKRYELLIVGRDQGLILDKLVIQPLSDAAPTITGPAASGYGLTNTNAQAVALQGYSVNMRMLMIGRSFTLDKNFAYGSSISFLTDPSLHSTLNGYTVPGFPQSKVRRFELSLPSMNDVDRFNIWRMETVNNGKPFLINAYPNRSEWMVGNYQFLARFGEALAYQHAHVDRHKTRIVALEA